MRRFPVAALVSALSVLAVCVGIASNSAPPRHAAPEVRPASDTPAQTAQAATPSATPNDTVRTFCLGCHNDKLRRGELSLASFDLARAAEHADVAEKIVRKLRTGMMPPREAARRPDAATRLALVTALETTLDAAAAAHANPGRRAFQRLNRAEYAAAIRTLFGLDIDVSTYL
ncbi:MAG TPA: DUF1587 domain-containing protein, partial [Vicinamibacterales bacterium]|nr:DUF1587 domain-containing protein [Vicinamibacterales bacterium]